MAADRVDASVEAATRELRAALERSSVNIIQQAEDRAERIEQVARRRADEIEREARTRATEARGTELDRIARLAEGIDALESGLRGMITDLRDQLRAAIADLEQQFAAVGEAPLDRPPGSEGGEVTVADIADTRSDAGGPDGEPEVRGLHPAFPQAVPLSFVAEVDGARERGPQLDEIMRGQIVSLRERGKDRAEAERFLARFKSGHNYAGLIDEVYPSHEQSGGPGGPAGKRRRFIRRRA